MNAKSHVPTVRADELSEIRKVDRGDGVMVPLVDFSVLNEYMLEAKKTKPIRVQQMATAVDEGLVGRLKVSSLEGDEDVVSKLTFICSGVEGEMWIQSQEDLKKGYEFLEVDPDKPRWLVFVPRPEDSRFVVLITSDNGFAIHAEYGQPDGQFQDGEDRYVLVSEGRAAYAVTREPNDPENHNYWLVAPTIFNRSYEWQ